MSTLALVFYFTVLGVLSILGLQRGLSALLCFRYRSPRSASGDSARHILVQLPIYNEATVAERLLRSAADLRFPGNRGHIQVLDDSTDGTRGVVDRVARDLRAAGVRIEVVRRPVRKGFKAGALAYGLEVCPEADVVAIFDADFLPEPDFLERTVPLLLAEPDLGLVQTRWGHLNRDASLLTRAQAVFLDGHFAVEHAARAAVGHPFNFNGTAGVWRRQAIDEAGGWQSDTITEDLDLSYRAQMKGWRFVYAHDVVAPAELPESWAAFRAQQARWTRGSVETARKLLPQVLRADFDLGAKVDAFAHLTANFAYGFTALLAASLPIALVLREELGWRVPGGRPLLTTLDFSMLGAGTLALLGFYLVALRRTGAGPLRRLGDVFFGLCLGAGMSLSNTREILRGLTSKQSEFIRTPKKGSQSASSVYKARSAPPMIFVELAFALYFGAAVVYAMTWEVWGALPFLLIYLFGFATVGVRTALEAMSDTRGRESVPAVDLESAATDR